MEEKFKVEFNPRGQKFTVKLGDKEALLAYTEINDVWDIHTVLIPEDYRGQGIAELLTLYVFNFAKERNIKIFPNCPYVKNKFLKDHPELTDILEDWFMEEED